MVINDLYDSMLKDAEDRIINIIKTFELMQELEDAIHGSVNQEVCREYLMGESDGVRDAYILLKELGYKHEDMAFVGSFNEIMENYRKRNNEIMRQEVK